MNDPVGCPVGKELVGVSTNIVLIVVVPNTFKDPVIVLVPITVFDPVIKTDPVMVLVPIKVFEPDIENDPVTVLDPDIVKPPLDVKYPFTTISEGTVPFKAFIIRNKCSERIIC